MPKVRGDRAAEVAGQQDRPEHARAWKCVEDCRDEQHDPEHRKRLRVGGPANSGRRIDDSMSIADDWRNLDVGSALLEEIEREAAADGIELLFGDTLRTNYGMIGLARSRGFRLGQGSNRASCELKSGWRTRLLTCRASSGTKSPAARSCARPERRRPKVAAQRRV